jgi:chromosomal replication initiator protein
MYVIKEVLGMSTSEIGDEFGGRDHSTVVYAIQQVEKNQEKNSQFKATVNDIIKNIRDR